MADTKANVLFEVSWEVCNKVGGIYTVVKSKAALMKDAYKEYYLVGPYFHEKARQDLLEENAPDYLSRIFEELGKFGIKCHFSTWQIKGDPKAILLDFSGYIGNKDRIKGELWNDFKIDSLHSGWDFEEPMLWAICVGILIQKFNEIVNKDNSKKIVAHFHEWMAGIGLLYLRKNKVKVATTFTTHATMLGRSICGSGGNLYEDLDNINPDQAAYSLGVQDKYQIEKHRLLPIVREFFLPY